MDLVDLEQQAKGYTRRCKEHPAAQSCCDCICLQQVWFLHQMQGHWQFIDSLKADGHAALNGQIWTVFPFFYRSQLSVVHEAHFLPVTLCPAASFAPQQSSLQSCRPDYLNQTLHSLAALSGLSKVTVYISQDGNNSAVLHVVTENAASLSRPHSKGFEYWQRPRVAALGDKQVRIQQCACKEGRSATPLQALAFDQTMTCSRMGTLSWLYQHSCITARAQRISS